MDQNRKARRHQRVGLVAPAHIHFEIHGQFERLITQMYFPGEPLNTCDRLLNAALRPDLLIATCLSPQDPPGRRVLNFDIVLSRG
jgi:protocatechuate 3,4-dioxygenase beta subunit